MKRLLLLSPLAAACPRPEVDCTTLGEPSLELGQGQESFVPLTEDATLVYELGPQGGRHVWGALRAREIDPGDPDDFASPRNPEVTLALELDDEIIGGFLALPRAFDPGPDGAWDLVGQQLVLEVGDPGELEGAPVILRAHLEDACGGVLDAEATVAIAAPSP